MEYHQMNQHTQLSSTRRGGEKMTEKLFEEIMFQKFPNLTQDIKLQIQEILTPSRINSNRPIMRYIVVELSKDKDRILEVAKEK